jgi:hypothetical protein
VYSLTRLASSLPNPEVTNKVADSVANSCVSVFGMFTSCLVNSNSNNSSDIGSNVDSVSKQGKAVWH